MEAKLIGLYSPAPQSGKSTVAQILAEAHGYRRKGFADPLRSMARHFIEAAGYSAEQADFLVSTGEGKLTPLPEFGGRTSRYLMQTLGTEWGRELVADGVWIGLALKGTERAFVVLDDMRFPDEYDAVVEAGGEVWKVFRPGIPIPTDHPSEGLLEDRSFDEVIVNDSSVEVLALKTRNALLGPF